jgi:hypothetical protein
VDQELFNVYRNSVGNRGSIVGSGINGSFSPKSMFERDKNLVSLERSVFGMIQEIAKEPEVIRPEYKNNGIQNISVEDAIKELLELEKNLTN